MCYAIPGRILEVAGDSAVVDFDGVRKRANVSLIEGAKVGEYVLVHAGFAIERLSRQSAKESLSLIREMMRGAVA